MRGESRGIDRVVKSTKLLLIIDLIGVYCYSASATEEGKKRKDKEKRERKRTDFTLERTFFEILTNLLPSQNLDPSTMLDETFHLFFPNHPYLTSNLLQYLF